MGTCTVGGTTQDDWTEADCRSVNGEYNKKGGCMVSTVATDGSELAPQVAFLKELRDDVRRTDWGERSWDGFLRQYDKLSPLIVERMLADPELRDTVRWAVVQPLVNYAKLLLLRPDADAIPSPGNAPAVQALVDTLRRDMDAWLNDIPPSLGDRADAARLVEALDALTAYVSANRDVIPGREQ